jgi:hypothetical protein
VRDPTTEGHLRLRADETFHRVVHQGSRVGLYLQAERPPLDLRR